MKLFFTMFFSLLLSITLFGQGVTTSSLSGTVKDNNGKPLAGANVVAIHVPSGTAFGASTRVDGRYNIPGVRVGGPYTVTVSYVGYTEQRVEGVNLSLGQDRQLNFELTETTVQGEAVTIIAESDPILTASNTGTETNVTTAQIENLPTISRSISDFTRLTPQANGTGGTNATSIGGKNNRQNNFQVDGAVMNDVFGLNADGLPTGSANAQPISLDAIQEFQVQIAPFDVRSGSFAGGLINAITRSGTNTLTGSAYFFGQNETFVGDFNGNEFGNFDDFQTGFRLGGPLKKDKVFFFINAEIHRRNSPDNGGLIGSNSTNIFSISQDEMKQIIDIANSVYGYNPGGFDPFTNETNDQKIFARLDINLSPKHRLTLRNSYVDADRDDGIDRSGTDFTLESNQFKRDNQTNSTVLQLNSSLSSNTANEFRVSYTTVADKRSPLFAAAPEFQLNLTRSGDDIGEIRFGVERFSQANALDQNTFELTDNFHYYTGDHTITLGTHNEFISFDNLFIQDAFGAYEFEVELNDLANSGYANRRPDRFFLSQSRVPGVDKPRAAWDYIQLGFYAQDEWKVSPQFNLTYGLRADIPTFPDDPLDNPTFTSDFGLKTSDVPSSNIMWSPRVGFNYDVSGDRSTQVRGGLGLFAGVPPGVWLSNQYSNTGVDFARAFLTGTDFDNLGLQASADPNAQPQVQGSVPTSDIAITDKDFKMPQVLRTNIAVDHRISEGFVGTVEFLYGKNVNEVFFKNLNMGDPNNPGAPLGVTPDGRPDYKGSRISNNFNSVILLDNTSEGHQTFVTARLQKQFNRGPVKGLYGSLAYTWSDVTDINSGRSSRAISNWRFNETNDPNGENAATSDFEVKHRIVGDLSYGFNYGNGFGTTISLFYEGRSGNGFSYLYDGNVNGDVFTFDNDLAYIPASRSDVSSQVSDADWAEIETFINSSSALQDARGKIFPRNSARAPWQNRLDMRIAQKIPSISGQKFELTLDMLNVLSLLKESWGDVQFVRFDAQNLFNFNGYDSEGKPIVDLDVFDRNGDGTVTEDDVFQTSDLVSRWQIQLGLRYSF